MARTELQQSASPLAIDLFCGLGGWTDGLLAEGYYVVGFDNVRHVYGDKKYPAQLVIQDVMTLSGAQFKDAALIVASPPCQEYSYMAMPWSRAKDRAAKYRSGELDVAELNRLFDAAVRIGREAGVPTVIENVRGAIPWVGRSRWNYGSYHLWGDVPALMPMTKKVTKNTGGSWFGIDGANPVNRYNPRDADDVKAPGQDWNNYKKNGEVSPDWKIEGLKSVAHPNRRDGHRSTSHLTNPGEHIKCGGDWFDGKEPSQMRHYGSKSSKRKEASATIAKIPLALARHIARVYRP